MSLRYETQLLNICHFTFKKCVNKMYILFGHCYVLLTSVLTDLFNSSKVLKLWGAPTEEALLVLWGGGRVVCMRDNYFGRNMGSR
jgi:hypothetical protein